jgi:hypothetical protein
MMELFEVKETGGGRKDRRGLLELRGIVQAIVVCSDSL